MGSGRSRPLIFTNLENGRCGRNAGGIPYSYGHKQFEKPLKSFTGFADKYLDTVGAFRVSLADNMEINSNMNVGGLNGLTPIKPSKPAVKNTAVDDSFASSNALASALNNVPDTRPDAVARAQQLIADPNYPSSDIVRQMSSFFASKLTAN